MFTPPNVLHLPTECANRGHSASFPISLPTWFIKLFTREDDVVLDPFIGSGTTAIACLDLKRHYIGIETMDNYHQLAQDSIETWNTKNNGKSMEPVTLPHY